MRKINLVFCLFFAVFANAQTYSYRGMHLDVSRHFFSKEVVKKYIDTLAAHNINYFHWHLTDDQGWRIEIKKYPKLTEVGAWRTEKDGTIHGGFYSQEDIKEIVAYASSKNITVVPEIDLPGHSTAAIAAYPFLSCHRQPIAVSNHWGIHRDILCPTDSTIQFFKDVLDEVLVLFPSHYIHLGGDEVPKNQWRNSDYVHELMKEKNLKNYEQVQAYFMHELENYVTAKGRRVIMWGEALRGGVSDSTIIMSWLDKSAGGRAAKQGREVIMAPRSYCYFDYPQNVKDRLHAIWMLYLSPKKVSKFNPKSKHLNDAQNAKIIGAEATLWTEYVMVEKHLWHQLMPRLEEFGKTLK